MEVSAASFAELSGQREAYLQPVVVVGGDVNSGGTERRNEGLDPGCGVRDRSRRACGACRLLRLLGRLIALIQQIH